MIALRAVLFAAALMPLVLLLRAVVAPGSTLWGAILEVVVALVLGAVWAEVGRHRTATGLGTAGAITALLIFLLRLLDSPATGRSWAGVRFWEGRSFFGLGSLLAGAVVAGVLLATGALARRARRSPTVQASLAAAAVLILVLLSLPALGGSPVVGIAGLAGLAAGGLLLVDRAPSRRGWLAVGGAAVVVLTVAGGFALASEVGRSHQAAALPGSGPGAASAAAAILVRRSSTAAGLLFFSPWTVAILASLAVVGYSILRARGRLERAPRGRGLPPPDRHLQVTIVGLLVAAPAALITSVRGAVTAAIILMAAALLGIGGLLDRLRAPRATARRG